MHARLLPHLRRYIRALIDIFHVIQRLYILLTGHMHSLRKSSSQSPFNHTEYTVHHSSQLMKLCLLACRGLHTVNPFAHAILQSLKGGISAPRFGVAPKTAGERKQFQLTHNQCECQERTRLSHGMCSHVSPTSASTTRQVGSWSHEDQLVASQSALQDEMPGPVTK